MELACIKNRDISIGFKNCTVLTLPKSAIPQLLISKSLNLLKHPIEYGSVLYAIITCVLVYNLKALIHKCKHVRRHSSHSSNAFMK